MPISSYRLSKFRTTALHLSNSQYTISLNWSKPLLWSCWLSNKKGITCKNFHSNNSQVHFWRSRLTWSNSRKKWLVKWESRDIPSCGNNSTPGWQTARCQYAVMVSQEHCFCRLFTGRKFFLSSNQQHQSTEFTICNDIVSCRWVVNSKTCSRSLTATYNIN